MKPSLTITALLAAALAPTFAAVAPKAAELRIPVVANAESTISHGLKISDFRQREPHAGQPATLKTEAYVGQDKDALHVVFVCTAPREQVRARMSQRESIGGDDKVAISLDTFHDGQRAYMFFVNPLGVQRDGVTTEGQADDFTFDTLWQSEGRLTDSGYVVRMSIPWKSLRRAGDASGTWGVALTRYIANNDEYATWPRINDDLEAYVPQFAPIAAPGPQRSAAPNLSLTPYAFLAGRRTLAGSQMQSANELRGGVDGKLVVDNNMTFDFTVNPDFSQVESDEPQVTVNRRWEAYFPERRPFFKDNASFFRTPEMLFFSRRIIDPEFGGRFTGKAGNWTIGVLGMDDRSAMWSGESDSRAMIGVARIDYELGNGSSAGGFVASRRAGSRSNEVASFDTRIKFGDNWVVTAQAARSETKDLGKTASGTAFFGSLARTGRQLNFSSKFRDRSAGFEADLGFIPRVDIRQAQNNVSWDWRPENRWLNSFGPSFKTYTTWDHAGKLQDWSASVPFWFEFRGGTSAYVGRDENYEFVGGRGIRTSVNSFYVQTAKLKWIQAAAYYGRGSAINYFPAEGRAPFSGRSNDGSVELAFQPTQRARFEQTWFFTSLRAANSSVFTNHLMRSKVSYQLTRTLSARVIFDYQGTLPNEALVDLSRDKRLVTDVLVTWMLNPGTALHAGYSDQRENLMWINAANPMAMRQGAPTFQTGRQLFAKLSYCWRP